MKLWDHQTRSINLINGRRKAGVRRLVVQGPTGSGKTVTFLELIKQEVSNGGRCIVYTNRKTLRQQISDVLDDHRVWHGVRAAGERPALNRQVQVSSIMTERVRSLGEDPRWDIHDATLVIVDEAHSQRAAVARKLLAKHYEAGAFILGFTATPVGIGGLYDDIVSMAELSELRQAGVLVPCIVYAPEEIDMTGIRTIGGEFNRKQAANRVRETIVIGKVIDHWVKLNPAGAQTVLFAPGVPESRWFSEQFAAYGYRSAHVDAKTNARKRKEIFGKWRTGEIQVVCNFGILREGFDLRDCRHAILAQPTNQLSTYLQMVGRVIRSAPGKTEAILQDHVGAYHRLGSPNIDRSWELGDTDASIKKAKDRRDKLDKEEDDYEGPAVCPKCGCIRYAIPGFYGKCPKCGYECEAVSKIVRQTNGKLKKIKEGPAKKKDESKSTEAMYLKRAIYSGVHLGHSAGQVLAIASRKNGKFLKQENHQIRLPRIGTSEWQIPAAEFWEWASVHLREPKEECHLPSVPRSTKD